MLQRPKERPVWVAVHERGVVPGVQGAMLRGELFIGFFKLLLRFVDIAGRGILQLRCQDLSGGVPDGQHLQHAGLIDAGEAGLG